jgi:hypothetical protein
MSACIKWRVLDLWPKKLNFQNTFKIDISLNSFQQLDLNGHDPWNIRFDFETKGYQLSLQSLR